MHLLADETWLHLFLSGCTKTGRHAGERLTRSSPPSLPFSNSRPPVRMHVCHAGLPLEKAQPVWQQPSVAYKAPKIDKRTKTGGGE